MVAHPDAAGRAGEPQPNSPDGAQPRPAPASPLSAAPGPAAQGQADGLNRLSGRIPRRREDTQSSSCRRARQSARGARRGGRADGLDLSERIRVRSESRPGGRQGSNWSLRPSRNGRALPCPALITGLVSGGVSWKTPGAGGGGVNGMSTDAVSRPSPARWARTAAASLAPALIPRCLAGPSGRRSARAAASQLTAQARLCVTGSVKLAALTV
jgi:hypothetical protein